MVKERRGGGARTGRTAEAGFTLVELLLALVVSLAVVGGATLLAGRMQGAYRAQLDAATAQQEGRYIIQEIEQYLRAAGNNPYRVETTPCPVAGTPVMAIRIDPNGDGINDDVRLQSDARPTNGLIGGAAGACNEPGEDVSIGYDAAAGAVTIADNNAGDGPRPIGDAMVTGLEFVFRTPERAVTSLPASVAFVETRLTVRSRSIDLNQGTPLTYSLSSEVRMRSR